MPTLSLETVVMRSSEPIARSVDGDLLMLDPRHGRYFALDAIGNRIWALLERPQPVGALCTALEQEFDVTAEICRRDVLALLEQLSEAELVVTG